MKKISILALTLFATLLLSGCGSSGSSSSSTPTTSVIAAGETKTLTAGATLTSSTADCQPNIIVQADGSWNITNNGTTDCTYTN